MKGGKALRGWLIALAFAALGGCLLLAGQGLRTAGGVILEKTELPGGTGTLYRPADPGGSGTAADEDGHVYASLPGGALILSDLLDGADPLATELARRGVTVVSAGRGTDAALAWDRLLDGKAPGASRAILIASARRAGEAAALASEAAGTDRACLS